ncbi:MAG: glycosyltransferase [Flavobacteriales bacterium]|nr:glycosyltransferase [Flavobacteriales bacterium]
MDGPGGLHAHDPCVRTGRRPDPAHLSRRELQGLRFHQSCGLPRGPAVRLLHRVAQRARCLLPHTAQRHQPAHGLSHPDGRFEDRTSLIRLWKDRARFKKLLRTTHPDVVHVHYGSVSALFAVMSSSVPVVISFLGSDLDRPRDVGAMRTTLGRLFSQVAAFFSAGIICISPEPARTSLVAAAGSAGTAEQGG